MDEKWFEEMCETLGGNFKDIAGHHLLCEVENGYLELNLFKDKEEYEFSVV